MLANIYLLIGTTLSIFLNILASSHATPLEHVINEDVNIIGGRPARAGEFPWHVSIMSNNDHICGGTLIDYSYIVTAAHCVVLFYASQLKHWGHCFALFSPNGEPGIKKVIFCFVAHSDGVTWGYVVAGAHRLRDTEEPTQQRRQVVEIKDHTNYNMSTMYNDIALVRVSPPFQETAAVKRVYFSPDNHTVTGICTIAGWGITEPDNYVESEILLKASLPIVPKSECALIYGLHFYYETQICAGYPEGGVDACAGDTGGALICLYLGEQYFAGIVSWGLACAVANYPGVYTEVSPYKDWILEQ